MPHVLTRSDFLAVMPGRLAAAIAGKELVVRGLPFASDPFDRKLYRRHNRNEAHLWLRGELRKACKSLH
jgi:hypothetical protein